MPRSDPNPPPTSASVSRRAILAAGIATPLAILASCAPDPRPGRSSTAGSVTNGPVTPGSRTPHSRTSNLTSTAPLTPSTSANRTPSGRSGTLVVYFSRAGQNYWNGGRRDLKVGNTRRLVDMISSRIDCDTYEIVPADPYPWAYEPTVDRNVREMRADARPAIAHPLPDVTRYHTVLIGSPVWASQAPMIMSTFVEGVDLAGARILPFVTYAVSGMAGIDEHYRTALPAATVADGLATRGEDVDDGDNDLDAWLHTNGLLA